MSLDFLWNFYELRKSELPIFSNPVPPIALNIKRHYTSCIRVCQKIQLVKFNIFEPKDQFLTVNRFKTVYSDIYIFISA